MKKLKWWQWALIVVGGLAVVGTLADDPANQPAPALINKYEVIDAQFRKLAGDHTFVMTFNATADPVELEKTVRNHCGAREFCKVFGWTEPEYAPRGFPMTDREVQAQVLSYGINRTSGYEQLSWDCDLFGKQTGVECQSEEETGETAE